MVYVTEALSLNMSQLRFRRDSIPNRSRAWYPGPAKRKIIELKLTSTKRDRIGSSPIRAASSLQHCTIYVKRSGISMTFGILISKTSIMFTSMMTSFLLPQNTSMCR